MRLVVVQKPSVLKALRPLLDRTYELVSVAGHIMRVSYSSQVQSLPWRRVSLERLLAQTLTYEPLSNPGFLRLKAMTHRPWTQVIIATDPDIQGNLIGSHIALLFPQAMITRVLLEALTKEGITQAFEHKTPFHRAMGYQGQIKSRVDYLLGTIATRFASMKAHRRSKEWHTLTVGRVQTPTLSFIREREQEILRFQPRTHLRAYLGPIKSPWVLSHDQGLQVQVQVTGPKPQVVPPAKGLNTDRLLSILAQQREFPRGEQVAKVLETLYLQGVISYPRTDNQSYDNYPDLLCRAAQSYRIVQGREPVVPVLSPGDPTDHGPITLLNPRARSDRREHRVIDVLSSHMRNMFSGPNTYDMYHIRVTHRELGQFQHHWRARVHLNYDDGLQSYHKGPDLGCTLMVKTQTTRPPSRYTFTTLLQKMVSSRIGTKSTRSTIIGNLIQRGYVQRIKGSFKPTALVELLWSVLHGRGLDLTQPELTWGLESRAQGIKDQEELRCVEDYYRGLLRGLLA